MLGVAVKSSQKSVSKFVSANHINCRFASNKGTIKWYNNEKGYGFITSEDGNDIFSHISGVRGQGMKFLFEGDVVSYDVTSNARGLAAIDVELISPNTNPLIASRRRFYETQKGRRNRDPRLTPDYRNSSNVESSNAENSQSVEKSGIEGEISENIAADEQKL